MATVRRVRRIIRKIDPWTVLKVSSILWAIVALAFVLGVVIFWSVLERSGLPDRLTEFLVEITLIAPGSQPFANVEQFFRVVVFGSVAWWVVMTGSTVAFAMVYNLATDVVGGIEVVVLEETLNPVMDPTAPLHPPADYRSGNGLSAPETLVPEDQADIPTEESPPVPSP